MVERVQQSHEDLEEQVKARTKQLADLNEEFEARNAELERFTYTVSHDLSSPLITIKTFVGFVEQELDEGNPDAIRPDLERIKRAAKKMGRLLEELLELSRIGRLVNPFSEVPLAELAHETVELLRGPILDRGAQVEILEGLPTVPGNRPRLSEVFQNLLDNALKFMGDQPRPKVEIGVRQDGDERVFYVCDNGIGIEHDYQDRIFRLFDKLDRDSEGMGIGLALVKRIVEAHGGRIWVESGGYGRGSAFCFTLAGDQPTTGRRDGGEDER
jgi:signal transduction histidine kinase